MLRFGILAFRPGLRNQLVGDIPNPYDQNVHWTFCLHAKARMIANFVVRLDGSFDRCSAFHKKKKDGAGQ